MMSAVEDAQGQCDDLQRWHSLCDTLCYTCSAPLSGIGQLQGLMLCRRTKSCAAWSSAVAFFGDVLPASTDMPPAGICAARNGSASNSARNGFLDTGRLLESVRGDGRAGEGRAGDAAPRLRKGLFEGRSRAKPGEGLRSNSARDQDGSEWQKRSAKLRYVFGTGWAWETWKGCEARAARKLTGHRRLGG